MLFWLSLALAAGFRVESDAFEARDEAASAAASLRKDGYQARVLKRFALNEGYGFVVLVEELQDAAAAEAVAAKITAMTGFTAAVYAEEPVPAPEPAGEKALTPAEWMTRAGLALGGAGGGADALARAKVVHFVFERTLKINDKEVTVRHDYWRDGTNRRLDVQTFGNGTDSTAVTTVSSAWVKTGGTVSPRDIGVLVGTIDAFAPEAMLTIAAEGYALLRAPEIGRFVQLDGAEQGLRFGTGGDESEGLAWVEIDPETALIRSARYITAGGPIEWELRDWKAVAPGLMLPLDARMRRADGRRERVKVTSIELLEKAPDGLFAP